MIFNGKNSNWGRTSLGQVQVLINLMLRCGFNRPYNILKDLVNKLEQRIIMVFSEIEPYYNNEQFDPGQNRALQGWRLSNY